MKEKILANRYRLTEQIGMGGMAIVYRAVDLRTGHNVAVKVLRPEYNEDSEFISRFQREAEAASKMTHHNIVNLLDVGMDGENRYLVMEYVQGKTLKTVIQERGKLSPALAGQIAIRILSALNQANCPIYMMFGTESLGTQSPEQTITHFTTLLDSLIATAPESQVIVMSIPPVTAEAEKAADHPLLNSVIDDYNSRLLALCDKKNVYFVDINTALKNNEGKLDGHLATEDGMHLSLEGGMVLLNYVLSHVPQD